jgi:hypothetical protein
MQKQHLFGFNGCEEKHAVDDLSEAKQTPCSNEYFEKGKNASCRSVG